MDGLLITLALSISLYLGYKIGKWWAFFCIMSTIKNVKPEEREQVLKTLKILNDGAKRI